MSKLCDMAGCAMEDNPAKAGFVPTVDEYGETSVPGIYAAGDVSGIEEASSAMIEGRIAGIAAAARLGFISEETCKEEAAKQEAALAGLRQGKITPFLALRFLPPMLPSCKACFYHCKSTLHKKY